MPKQLHCKVLFCGYSHSSCCNTAPQRHRVSHQYSFNGAASMLHDLTSLQRCLRTVSKLMQSEAQCYQLVSCYYCSSRLRREGASGHMLVTSTLAGQELPNRFLGRLCLSLSHHVETTDTIAFVLFENPLSAWHSNVPVGIIAKQIIFAGLFWATRTTAFSLRMCITKGFFVFL